MKAFPFVIFALSSVFAAEAADSMVRFSNRDRIPGSLVSLSSDLLVWNSPLMEQPAPFFLKNVLDISLPAAIPESSADHEATLSLTNGDTVRGQLASVTDEVVSLDTWFAGRMNFNRLMVSGLKIEARASMLYRGPTGLDGWIQTEEKPAWTYSQSAFRSEAAGGIARDGLLPEECVVSFDIAWKGDALGLKVGMFSDDPESDGSSSGYEIAFQRGNISLRNCKSTSFLGTTHSSALMENDKVHVEIRGSRKTGRFCLYLNDRIVEVWTDPDVAKGKFGGALHFVSQNTLPLRVSGIEVTAWDGVVETLPEPRVGMMRQQFGLQGMRDETRPEPSQKPKEGRMELANGDTLAGEVVSIQDGLISVKTSLGDVKIPVARLKTVALKKVDLERCKRRNGDIRAWLPDGSSLVFRLDEVGEGTLVGSSQNFGNATFKTSAFNRMEFNIYDYDLEPLRGGEDW